MTIRLDTPFKAGDQVVCTDPRRSSLHYGKVYTVSYCYRTNGDNQIYVSIENNTYGWHADRFTLFAEGPEKSTDLSLYDETPEIAEIRANFIQQQEKT